MRKNFGKDSAVYPMPVFIVAAYDKNGTPNCMNAAWGGISEETEITICVDSKHKTAENLLIPYLLWVTFAGYLNLGAYLLNR